MSKKIYVQKIYALLIDYLFLLLLAFLLQIFSGLLLGAVWGVSSALGYFVNEQNIKILNEKVPLYIFLGYCFIYYSHAFKKSGQTIGEKIMKIKIVPAYRERISLLSGILRTIFLAPLLAIIGLIPVSLSPYKSLLDHICLTRTVKAEQKPPKE